MQQTRSLGAGTLAIGCLRWQIRFFQSLWFWNPVEHSLRNHYRSAIIPSCPHLGTHRGKIGGGPKLLRFGIGECRKLMIFGLGKRSTNLGNYSTNLGFSCEQTGKVLWPKSVVAVVWRVLEWKWGKLVFDKKSSLKFWSKIGDFRASDRAATKSFNFSSEWGRLAFPNGGDRLRQGLV